MHDSTTLNYKDDVEEAAADERKDLQVIMDDKTRWLVDWNVEILTKFIKQICSHREAREALTGKSLTKSPAASAVAAAAPANQLGTITVLDEVREVIELSIDSTMTALSSGSVSITSFKLLDKMDQDSRRARPAICLLPPPRLLRLLVLSGYSFMKVLPHEAGRNDSNRSANNAATFSSLLPSCLFRSLQLL